MLENRELSVQLEDDDATYSTGDTVQGTVSVSTGSSPVEEAELVIALEWFTHGFGNRAEETVAERTIPVENWDAESEHVYEFSLEAPPGPYTYRGRYVNVDWQIRAAADIPWEFDPEATRELTLEPESGGDYDPGDSGLHRSIREDAGDPGSIEIVQTIAGVFLLLFGLGYGYFQLMFVGKVGVGLIALGAAVALLVAGLGGWLFYVGVRNAFATARLGDVEVRVEPSEVAPGGTVESTVAIRPESGVDVNSITLLCKCRERATSGHGTNSTTRTELLSETGETVARTASETSIAGGEETEFGTTFEIPEGSPYTFHAEDNHVEWQLEVHVDIPTWPDLVHGEPFLVRPERDASTGSVPPDETRRDPEQRSKVLDPDEDDYEVVW